MALAVGRITGSVSAPPTAFVAPFTRAAAAQGSASARSVAVNTGAVAEHDLAPRLVEVDDYQGSCRIRTGRWPAVPRGLPGRSPFAVPVAALPLLRPSCRRTSTSPPRGAPSRKARTGLNQRIAIRRS